MSRAGELQPQLETIQRSIEAVELELEQLKQLENSALELELARNLEERSRKAVELGTDLAADRAHNEREICPSTANRCRIRNNCTCCSSTTSAVVYARMLAPCYCFNCETVLSVSTHSNRST